METLISIRFIAHLPSHSSVARLCPTRQLHLLAVGTAHTRADDIDLAALVGDLAARAAPAVTARSGLRACRPPHSSSTSASIIACRASMPAVRQKRSKQLSTACHASSMRGVTASVRGVVAFVMALLSLKESAPGAYRLKASNAAHPISTSIGTSPAPPTASAGADLRRRAGSLRVAVSMLYTRSRVPP